MVLSIYVRDVRKKEEGRVSTWVPTRYGFEPRIGRANLACKFRSKIIKPSNLMCFIETYREGITKISNKICSQKVTLIATRVPKILNLQG